MKKIIFVYIALVLVVVLLAAWKLGAFGFVGGFGNSGTVTINDNKIEVEVADDEDSRRTGLSGRDSLEEGQGMLFAFEEKQIVEFWMVDMKFPIDIIFIDDTMIVDIDANVQPPEEGANKAALPIYSPDVPVNYVLEVPGGFSEANNIKVGDTAKIDL